MEIQRREKYLSSFKRNGSFSTQGHTQETSNNLAEMCLESNILITSPLPHYNQVFVIPTFPSLSRTADCTDTLKFNQQLEYWI